jgi:hypothetical protein
MDVRIDGWMGGQREWETIDDDDGVRSSLAVPRHLLECKAFEFDFYSIARKL